ncbi:DUF3999 family protein [Xenorhabdus littoralis]|uniref:DUF3999 family protein n=1 Tax=Xenorhabdus littoralis TaxID=2582835 RepID=UPI0029E7D72C|nr:DUF3999 family protein [Xenorhabdus sp. psl]
MVLDWESLPDNWQTKVKVYSSDDLKNWQLQARDAPLMDLSSESGHLRLNSIDIQSTNKVQDRYWLLVLENPKNKIPIIKHAKGIAITRYMQTEFVDLSFDVDRVSETEAIYRFNKSQPLSKLLIYPRQYNTVLSVSLEYRNSSKEEWRKLSNSVIYKIEGTKGERISEPLLLNGLQVKELRVKAVSGSWGREPPIVVGKRNQVDVIFNAQGNAPYLLAWGSNQASFAAMDIKQLIPKGEMPEDGIRGLPMGKLQTEIVLGAKSD